LLTIVLFINFLIFCRFHYVSCLLNKDGGGGGDDDDDDDDDMMMMILSSARVSGIYL